MQRRHLILAPLALAPWATHAATDWPTKAIKLIVPYAPGGGPDVLTRQLAEKLTPLLGQTVYVENKVGAGGIVAAEIAAASPPDGYTIILGSSTHVTQKLIAPASRFDPLTQFEHIVRMSNSPSILVVDARSPWQTAQQLVDAARQEPGKLNYASGGIGSAAHLSAAALATQQKLQVTHIPYRGSVEIVPSILGGDTQFGFPVSSTAIPLIQQGKVRALATSGGTRLPQLPQVPTLKELFRSDDLVLESWSGLWAPAKTPREIVDKINRATLKALADPSLAKVFEVSGAAPAPTKTPEEFTRFVLAETAKYAKLVIAAKISIT